MNQYWSLKRAVLVGVLTSTHYIMRPRLGPSWGAARWCFGVVDVSTLHL